MSNRCEGWNFSCIILKLDCIILICNSISYYRLRQLDIELMKQIQHKVNIVPIIGKADTLTEPEMKRLKKRIMADIQEHNIQV